MKKRQYESIYKNSVTHRANNIKRYPNTQTKTEEARGELDLPSIYVTATK